MKTALVLCLAALVLFAVARELLGTRRDPAARRRFERHTNLGLGGVRGLAELATGGFQLLVFEGTREFVLGLTGRPALDAESLWTWALCLVGYDFLYYWAHRASHRSGLLWAVHEVHHQATRYDITVGLRVSILNSLSLLPFFLPLAAIGVPTVVYVAVAIVHLLGMTWLHTERITTVGSLGLVLVTPALHRVHHSSNARHMHCNFGGLLIVWDRLFGTYLPPEPVPALGIAGRGPAPGVLGCHLEPLVYLWARLRRVPGRWRKLRLLLLG